MQVGAQAMEMIVELEVSSEAVYTAHYTHPVWPGGSSGVTWGIGYDGGMHTASQIAQDWGGVLVSSDVALLTSVAGITGDGARIRVNSVHTVTVPYASAYQVFSEKTLPTFAAHVAQELPNCDKLHPDAFGALVSLAYNRGWAGYHLNDNRHLEMEEIKAAMESEHFELIPGYIIDMERLWPNTESLQNRRDDEASLFADAMGFPDPLPADDGPAKA